MKLSTFALALIWVSADAFSGPSIARQSTSSSALHMKSSESEEETMLSRRSALIKTSVAAAATFGLVMNPSNAYAGLLDEYGTDPVKIKEKAPAPAPTAASPKAESTIEPNLRSNYYYPTNKKRYLPRIKKCNDAIPLVAESIGDGDWEAVNDFVVNVADDTILPMKLYTSSLTGGGTNVKVSFTAEMMKAAEDFEKSQKAMVKAIKKKDQTASSKALEDMASALLAYRTSGRLLGPDGGGDIPSVDDIRRSACRVQGRTFEQRVKDRDARLKAAGDQ